MAHAPSGGWQRYGARSAATGERVGVSASARRVRTHVRVRVRVSWRYTAPPQTRTILAPSCGPRGAGAGARTHAPAPGSG
eukprot:scaffold9213_cov63-Phaeocystis_antarctica.AAC.5